MKKQQAENHYHRGKKQGIGQSRAGHSLGILLALGTQFACNIGAGTVTKEESEGLNDKHYRKHDAHSSRGLRVDFAHKIGIGHVIKARHQHRNDGGNGHGANHFRYGCRREEYIILVFLHFFIRYALRPSTATAHLYGTMILISLLASCALLKILSPDIPLNKVSCNLPTAWNGG